MGGIGFIAMAVSILPILQVGGMQIFRTESSDKSEKIKPRIQQIAGTILKVYLALTAACAIALAALEMPLFDAICHAMTALATGGYSTQDASIGHYKNPGIEWVLALSMFLGGTTFVSMAQFARGSPRTTGRSSGRITGSSAPCTATSTTTWASTTSCPPRSCSTPSSTICSS